MSDYGGVLLEDMNHKLDALLEGQAAMGHVPGDITQLKNDMFEVKTDIKAMKAAMEDQSGDHKQLAKRVTHLEQAAA